MFAHRVGLGFVYDGATLAKLTFYLFTILQLAWLTYANTLGTLNSLRYQHVHVIRYLSSYWLIFEKK